MITGGDRVQFQVLGPLRMERAGCPVDLGPSQQRVVLAVLLLNGNHTVGRQQLIDAIWDDAPTWAVNLLQRHVSRLRRALEPDRTTSSGPSALQWTDAGYRLAVPSDCIDLGTFDESVRQARTARRSGDVTRAADLLDVALKLWQGALCEGLTSPFLDAERTRMEERRAGVYEDRLELSVLLGTEPDVVERLRRLVAEYPFRERLRRLLMHALYRADRSADALTAYQDTRRVLRDELGIEPSGELQRLHSQILNKDPALLGPPIEESGAATRITLGPATLPTIAQLPHALVDFVGREDELELLDHAVQGSDGPGTAEITAITGSAGIGKTSLALQWAHRAKEQYPDGQLYVNLRGFDPHAEPMSPTTAIRGFLDALGIEVERIPADPDQQFALYRSLLDGRRVLVVLDNARNAEQVRPLLPGSSGCAVLVTSRDQLVGLIVTDSARALPLDLLPRGVARDLLSRRLGRSRVKAEPAAVDSIIDACARLPLALSVVAGRAKINSSFSLSALAGELWQAQGSLDPFDTGEHGIDVRAAFSWSYDGLAEPAARLFRQLSLIPGPEVSTAAAASLTALALPQVRPLLGQLSRANLVAERAPGRFTLHDLLRVYAGEMGSICDDEESRRDAYRRLIDHYLHTAVRADHLLNPYRDDAIDLGVPAPGVTIEALTQHDDGLRWFRDERDTLVNAVRHAAKDGFEAHSWRLAWAMAHFLERQAHWEDSANIHGEALQAAQRTGETRAQAVSRGGLAYALVRLERGDEAYLQLTEALEQYETLKDVLGMAHAHRSLTWVLDTQRRYDEALGHAQAALRLFVQAGHRSGEARALNAIGWFHYQLGEPTEALRYCQLALDLQQEIGATFDQADTLDSAGRAYQELGRQHEAIACFQKAIDTYRTYGHRYNEADQLLILGDSYATIGRGLAARQAWEDALRIFDDLNHPDATAARERLASAQL